MLWRYVIRRIPIIFRCNSQNIPPRIFIGLPRVWKAWSYNQEKCNLHKCVILSQTKNIEKVLFKFLLWEFVHLCVLFQVIKVII